MYKTMPARGMNNQSGKCCTVFETKRGEEALDETSQFRIGSSKLGRLARDRYVATHSQKTLGVLE
jgi:hypothetical protein